MTPPTRPNLQTYLDAHPNDLAAAVDAYRAAVHAHDIARVIAGSRGPAVPWRPFAVGACLLVVALLLMRALGGCGAPPVDARGCVAACGREVDACLARCGRMATDVDGGE